MRDAWTVEHEAFTRVIHHYTKHSTLLPLSWQRRSLAVLAKPNPKARVSVEKLDVDGVPCAWFRPEDADPDRTLVYLHGGGYSLGSIDSHRHFVSKLARKARMNAFAIDYRLAPEHVFPAQLEDSVGVWRWLMARGVNPQKAVLCGESAGGGLTMSTLIALRDAGEPLPSAAIVLSPWVDLTLRGRSHDDNAAYDYLHRSVLEIYVRRFVPERVERTHPLVSPVYANLRGLPPLLIQAGGAEALLDDAQMLRRRAQEHGVDVTLTVYDDMVHAFMLFAGVRRAQDAVSEMVGFLDQRAEGSRLVDNASETHYQ